MYIFISHSSSDASIANEICDMLENSNYKCFLAPRDIQAGKEYAEEIINGIDRSDICLLLLSKRSNQSPHVLREIERAVSKSIPVFVYQLEDVTLTRSMEYFLMTHQWMNTNHRDDIEVIRQEIEEYEQVNSGTKETLANAAQGKSKNQSVTVLKQKKRKRKIAAFCFGIVGIVLCMFVIVKVVSPKNASNFEETESSVPTKEISLVLGEKYQFGTYYDAPIEWRLIHFSDDEKCAYLVSEQVLCMKGFDGAEGGRHKAYIINDDHSATYLEDMDAKQQVLYGGNNDWEQSNLRTWLNSDLENVEYADCPPIELSMSSCSNGYSSEPGFLCGFSDMEKEALCETEVVTEGNGFTSSQKVITQDKVFLLSREEMNWLKEADVSLYAIPTDEAVEKNENSEYFNVYVELYDVVNCIYRLRDPVENSPYKSYLVGNGWKDELFIDDVEACDESYGIRPVICVDTEKFKECLSIAEIGTASEQLKLGDRVILGSYHNEQIEWRVIHMQDDQTAVLISEDILTMKAYDGAESGHYEHRIENDDGTILELVDAMTEQQVQCAGNSSWATSNLRTWLNSKEQVVTYFDQPPLTLGMCMYRNGYQDEKGFLASFSEEEREVLVTRRVEAENPMDKNGLKSYTEDYVFLLSEEELKWLYEANVNIYSKPTTGAVEHDQTEIYEGDLRCNLHANYHYYWLRDTYDGWAYLNLYVSNGLDTTICEADVSAASWIGVRPAISVDIEKLSELR